MITAIANPDVKDRYHTTGTAVQQVGWKALDVVPERRQERAPETPTLPPGLKQGQSQAVVDAEALKKKTRPPKRFTEATLLTAMETAGKTLDEKELSDAMKETGLGTPATRAAIIEVLLKRGYIVRGGQDVGGHGKGHPSDRGGASRGEEPGDDGPVGGVSEAYPARDGEAGAVHEGIENYVSEVVGKVGQYAAPPRPQRRVTGTGPSRHELGGRSERTRGRPSMRPERDLLQASSASRRSAPTRKPFAGPWWPARTCCW